MEILDQACEAVRTFRPLSGEEVDALLVRTAQAASSGEYEPFKTTSIFDGTAQYPEWLGEEPEQVQQLMLTQPETGRSTRKSPCPHAAPSS
jgi:hypothetical protein